MPTDRDETLAAMEVLTAYLEDRDEVAYAEVGGVVQYKTDAVVTREGTRNATAFTETGVWCRVFANGAADYRYTTALDEESLRDEADRAIRSAAQLAQTRPARVDTETLHRAVHGGWGTTPRLTDLEPEAKVDRLRSALDASRVDGVDRVRVTYADASVDHAITTTTGSAVRTTFERASTDLVVDAPACPTVRRFAGTLRGTAIFDEFESLAAEAFARVDDLRDRSADALAEEREADVVLSPRATAQLVHHLSHALEADAGYLGLPNHAVGDEVAGGGLAVEDAIRAGSWGAMAYDAEARPTEPVALVRDGAVASLLHDTESAADHDAFPAGTAVPSLGFDAPPRIHARHLDVEAGTASETDLLAGATAYVERFDPPRYRDDLEARKRSGWMPPSVLYARDLRETAAESDRPDRGRVDWPIAEGYRVEGGERTSRLDGAHLASDPATLRGISMLGSVRETTTGVCDKHRSRLPYAVTAPAVRLTAVLAPDDG
ncbi:metallopeptidase TldD-related protein [Halomarina pelagica]|uniref:metallopeptidase TldD-related protein n=1 Tax=Halomarina pelagica TaxID=2961599 RepID=UPI0020C29CFD|nr:metallopeptidase TldD-related protein [Halomarina sp. BND7]